MKIIDLSAFEPEALEITMPSNTIYTIPGNISVQTMTKIMSFQQQITDTGKTSNELESLVILQDFVFFILSLDESKTISKEDKAVKADLNNFRVLKAIPEIFNEHMKNIINQSLPNEGENPNMKSSVA